MQTKTSIVSNIETALISLVAHGPEVKNMPEYNELIQMISLARDSYQNTNEASPITLEVLESTLSLLKNLNYLRNHSVMYLFDLEQKMIDTLYAYALQQKLILTNESVPHTLEQDTVTWQEIFSTKK